MYILYTYLSSHCFRVKCNNDFSSPHTCLCGICIYYTLYTNLSCHYGTVQTDVRILFGFRACFICSLHCLGASGDFSAENAASPTLPSAQEQQEEEWKTELARVCTLVFHYFVHSAVSYEQTDWDILITTFSVVSADRNNISYFFFPVLWVSLTRLTVAPGVEFAPSAVALLSLCPSSLL